MAIHVNDLKDLKMYRGNNKLFIPACLSNIALDKKSKNKNYIYSSSQIFQIL